MKATTPLPAESTAQVSANTHTSITDTAAQTFLSPPGDWKPPKGYDVLAVSTNPLAFLLNQYPLCFDYIQLQKGLSHEIRLNVSVKAQHIMLHNGAYDRGFESPSYRYSGYSLDYTLKLTHRKPYTEAWRYMYKGLQVRYSSRDLSRVTVEVQQKGQETTFKDTIHPHSNALDLVFVYGMQVRHKRLFMDAYTGLGLGYKTFNSPYSFKEFDILDSRFKPDRWNTFYVPLRLGFRVGVIL